VFLRRHIRHVAKPSLGFRAVTMRGASIVAGAAASTTFIGGFSIFLARLLGTVTMRVASADCTFFFRARFGRWR
jgi:hypothetical protein